MEEKNNVEIQNNKGRKTIETLKNGKKTTKSVKLTKKEIQNVQNKIFMPKFWNNCKPGKPCASKNRTRKQRRN